tara:strand:- start:28 stop:225 length:198 start_codon:yes stop_codon:yes gene_type:complete
VLLIWTKIMEMLHPQMVFHEYYLEKKTLWEIMKKEMCELVVYLTYFSKIHVKNNCLCKTQVYFFK